MQIHSLLYVSRSLLPTQHDDHVVDMIVKLGQERNAYLGVTGALIFTHLHFAQYLEGSRSNVDVLMESIRHDRRHAYIDILNKNVTSQRMFSQWGLAYSGPSHFADRQIGDAAGHAQGTARPRIAERLLLMMREFCSLI